MTLAEAVRGIDLPRLLDLARLTPAQAVVLAADVLTAAPARPPAPAAVQVGPDGRARLRATAGGRADSPADSPGALLEALATAARQGRPPTGHAAEILAALDRAAAEAAAGAAVAALAEPLRELAAAAGPAPRSELVRLVAAATGRAQPGMAAPAPAPPAASISPAPRTDRSGDDPPSPEHGPTRRRAGIRTAVHRTWPWIASVAALVAVLALELLFVRDDITRDVGALLAAGHGAPTSTAAAGKPPALAPVAPAAAAGVLGVDMRASRPCTPGATCEVRVHVRVSPQPAEQTVAWDYRVVDRCTGAVSTVAGGSAVVAPGGDRADVITTVTVPPGAALAVAAVTREPAVAGSPPLPVPAEGTCAPERGGRAG